MGVDPLCGREHGSLSLSSGKTDLPKSFTGVLIGGLPSNPGADLKIRPEGADTVHKGENVHVLMAAVSLPVNQPRLWGGAYFVEESPACQPGSKGGILLFHGMSQDLPGFCLELLHSMGTAAGTDLGRFAADKTGAGREP